MVVGQAEIVSALNLSASEEFAPWWNIDLGIVSVEDQRCLDELFPDNLFPSERVSRLLEPPGDLRGLERAAEAMKTSPLILSCEFADRGQVEEATGYFHLEVDHAEKIFELLALFSSFKDDDYELQELLEATRERRRTVEECGPVIKATACRQAEAFSRSLAETAQNEILASRLWEEVEAFANHASQFENLQDLKG